MRRSGATIRYGAGRVLVFAGALAAAWAAVTLLTGGFALHAGTLALSSRDPVRPLIVAAAAAGGRADSACRGLTFAETRPRAHGQAAIGWRRAFAGAVAVRGARRLDRLEHARRRRIRLVVLRPPGGGVRARAADADQSAAAPSCRAPRPRCSRRPASCRRASRRSPPSRSAGRAWRWPWRPRGSSGRDAVFLVVPVHGGARGVADVPAGPAARRRA